ncbi:hypothetical protein SAMN02745218_01124 [Desulfofundulus australicus DSM 11792]|uniref:Uncharacterized protein n=1 Tax=Desulfofundulus australicus DSM 11792 TaxID=1121425 RepID=A0A1M4XQI8_9FIRM|nr:hypothetical protein [Desulfofundulus australicus]SHE95502.1 hypothetical protein SAMN02745218_01124 [Desulfofundulus australicus DSM 11792]
MAKRSELREGMYVRMNPELDPDSYWQRLIAGRYFRVGKVAEKPDDAEIWSPCFGNVLYWSTGYVMQVDNENMMLISEAEQERIRYILKHKQEFGDLFRVGRKLERAVEMLDDYLRENCEEHVDLWDIMDAEHLADKVRWAMSDEAEENEIEEVVSEAVEMWGEIEELLEKLDRLEDKYVRSWVRQQKPADWEEVIVTETPGYRLLNLLIADFAALRDSWTEELGSGYPFSEDLDELIIKLVKWRDSVRGAGLAKTGRGLPCGS